MLRNLERSGDPWGLGSQHRLDWTQGLGFEVAVVVDQVPDDVEYLFWVGCAGRVRRYAALDNPGDRPAVAQIRNLLRSTRPRRVVTETRRGGSATSTSSRNGRRRTSNASDRRRSARCSLLAPTVSTQHRTNIRRSVEIYFEVVHHAQLFDDLVSSGRLSPHAIDQTVTYHDPCYLGRHNRVFDEPRTVVHQLDQPTADRDASLSRARLLLRSGWHADVDGGVDRYSDQSRQDRRGAVDRCRRRLDGMSLLQDHDRRCGAGGRVANRTTCESSTSPSCSEDSDARRGWLDQRLNPSTRAMIIRCTSEVPSPISRIFSRHGRSVRRRSRS